MGVLISTRHRKVINLSKCRKITAVARDGKVLLMFYFDNDSDSMSTKIPAEKTKELLFNIGKLVNSNAVEILEFLEYMEGAGGENERGGEGSEEAKKSGGESGEVGRQSV